MRTLSLISVLALALPLSAACGTAGDDDDDNGVADAAPGGNIDAPISVPDAPPAGATLGQTCNGSQGQADCATGLECLSLTGGTNPWCSEACTPGSACGATYSGPGSPNCYLGVDFGGGDVRNFCGIVCEDLSGGQICPTCDGTCPGTLACTAALTNQGGMTVARGCQ